ncbi:MAG: primase-helicase zinc-binding domain-containing protein [bacterium]
MILTLLQQDGIIPKKVASTRGGEYASSCPGCGGKDRFRCWPSQNNDGKWWCRQCGKRGDSIQYLREFRNLSYREACTVLGRDPAYQKKTFSWNHSLSDEWAPRKKGPREKKWCEKASAFLTWSHEQLITSKETLSLVETTRGLTLETIKTHSLGWNPLDIHRDRADWGLPSDKDRKLWLPPGLVIPCFREGSLQRIRIRTGKKEIPYYFLPGSSSQCMVLNEGRRVYIVVESELDALLLRQESENIGIVALGTAQTRPDDHTEKLLRESECILIALDADAPGAKEAWQWWPVHFPQAKRWPPVDGKDPCDMWKKGINLSEWIHSAITAYKQFISLESYTNHAQNNGSRPHIEMEKNDTKSVSIEGTGEAPRKKEEHVQNPDPADFEEMFRKACDDINKRYLKAGITNDTVSSLTAFMEKNRPDVLAMIADKERILDDLWLEGKDLAQFRKTLIDWYTLRLQELKEYISSVEGGSKGYTIELYSELVKDSVYLCEKEEGKQSIEKQHPDKAVFLPSEIKVVSRLAREEVKKIHLLKQHFGGCILPTAKKGHFNKNKNAPRRIHTLTQNNKRRNV